MPNYTYRDRSTGKEWTEFRKIADSHNGVGGDIVMVLSAPNIFPGDVGASHKLGDSFQRDILGPKVLGMTGETLKGM